jgi:hypothetical protein
MTGTNEIALTPRQRLLSLAAVTATAFGVGLSFGIGFPLTALTFEAWGEPKWMIGLAGAAPAIAVLFVLPMLPRLVMRLGPVTAIAILSAPWVSSRSMLSRRPGHGWSSGC